MTLNRLSDLQRPDPDYPRHFVPGDIDLSRWEAIEPLFQDLLERRLPDREALEHWLLDSSEFFAVISEEGSRLRVATTVDTTDREAEKGYMHFVQDLAPKMAPLGDRLNRKLLDCPASADLDPDRYQVMLRSARNAVELYRDENVPLNVELNKLTQEYRKIMGALSVNFRGREHTMQQMQPYQLENDRDLRRQAWEAAAARFYEDHERLDELFDKMIAIRLQVARNAGFDNYRDYAFRAMERFDYTPEDCLNYHHLMEDVVVPVNKEAMETRRAALGVESVRPWDVVCDKYGRPPLKPFQETAQLMEGCLAIFKKIDPQFGGFFRTMMDKGLLDLDNRKGKAPGGYQQQLSEVRLPFIFMNAVGLHRDLVTLLHEGGHAFHQFLARNEPLIRYRRAPTEFAEVASMSMEKLGSDHFDVFYDAKNAARARYELFAHSVDLLAWVARVDAFQHWVYTNPEAGSEKRADHWRELRDRFGSGVDSSGYEEYAKYGWQHVMHIFQVPFYFMEYGIAQLGAFQVWGNARRDLREAVAAYKRALSLGGSKPLPQLFAAAGIEFDFTGKTLSPIMDDVHGELQRLEKLER